MESARLRSRAVILLIAAALLTSLAFGVAFIAAHRVYDLSGEAFETTEPLTDDQTRQQLLDSARQYVGAAKLGTASGTYLLRTCVSDDQPPYQGTVYLNFDVPSITDTPAYFREIARVMKTRGWSEGLPPQHHPGGWTMAKDGVVAYYYRHPDLPGRGVLQIYGECRNVTDHRLDSTGFVDITGELSG